MFAIEGDTRRVIVGPCGIGADGHAKNVGSSSVSQLDVSNPTVVERMLEQARYLAWYQAVGGDLNETLYGDVDEVIPRLQALAKLRGVHLADEQLEQVRNRFTELAATSRYDPVSMKAVDDPLDYFRTIFLEVLTASRLPR